MSSSVKAVLFDFNGVIVDDFPIQKEAWNKMSHILRGSGVSDEEMIKQVRGVPTKDTIRRMGQSEMSSEELQGYAIQKDKMVQDLISDSPLFRLNVGLEQFLNDLKARNIPRTIATSSSKDMFTFLSGRLHLERWFDVSVIVCNDGTHRGKPAPDPYILAAQTIHVSPDECIVFEDAGSGIKSAFAAGCKNIYAIGTDDRLATLTQLPGVVKGIHDFTEVSVNSLF